MTRAAPPKLTVGELIDKLQTFPRDLRVVVDGYEKGFEDLLESSIQEVQADTYAYNDGTKDFDCYGPHALSDDSNRQGERVLCLPRRLSPEFVDRDVREQLEP